MRKDFMGEDLKSGDVVIFGSLSGGNLGIGILANDTAPTGGQIIYSERSGISRNIKRYSQMLKVSDPVKIADVKKRIVDTKGSEKYAKVLFSS